MEKHKKNMLEPVPGRKMVLCLSAIFIGIQLCFGFSVTSYVTDTDGITFLLNAGRMKVKVCQEDIVRVSYTTAASFPSKLIPIVNKVWPAPVFTHTEAGDTVTILAGRVKVKVSKSTASVVFADPADKVILSEYDKSLAPAIVEGVGTNTVTTTFNSPADEALYGLGQHQHGVVNYKGVNETIHQAYNDAYAESSPVLVSTKGYGILWDNYSLSWFYGGEGSNTRYRFVSECGDMIDYYFFYGPELDKVISGYRVATGFAPLFPKWVYGLIQSKDHYGSQLEMLSIKDGYRQNRIPVDCIVQDWQYWTPNPWGSHIMDPARYPDPKAMVDSLHRANIHTMISIWGLQQEGNPNYTELNSIGALWSIASGTVHPLDVYNAAGRAMYWRQINNELLSKYGFDAWWFDGNEPEGWPDPFDPHQVTTALGKGCLVYNTYSVAMTTDCCNFWRRDIPSKRTVILSRSSFAGQQRASTMMWNNDIQSNWQYFGNSIPAGLNLCMSGVPYWCTDIGGYWGNAVDWTTPANRELFTRWFQYGAFQPVCRIHGNGGSRELYCTSWDAATKANLLMIDKLRYRLVPYIYSLAWMVTSQDYTPMRHLVMDFRNDPNVKNIGSQYMFGPAFMVSPVATAGATSRSVYLPAGTWYDFWTGASVPGGASITAPAPLNQIPLHVRAGSIVAMGPEIQYATERADTIELRTYPGANGSFTFYEDEGDNYNYEQGKYATIPITYTDNPQNVVIGARNGTFPGMDQKKVFNIVYVRNNHGAGEGKTAAPDCQLIYTGSQVSCSPVGVRQGDASGLSNFVRTGMTFKTACDHIVFKSAFAGSTKTVAVYDLSGKLAGMKTVRKNAVDLRKDFNAPDGVYIVKIKTVQ
jgi:alpha-D-xyloside xylohydrolase